MAFFKTDESTGERSARYERCKAAVGRIVERVRQEEAATKRKMLDRPAGS